MHEALHRFYNLKQDKHTSNRDYLEKFPTQVELCDAVGGSISHIDSMLRDILKNAGNNPDNAGKATINSAPMLAKQQ